jgi:hypothetical protein
MRSTMSRSTMSRSTIKLALHWGNSRSTISYSMMSRRDRKPRLQPFGSVKVKTEHHPHTMSAVSVAILAVIVIAVDFVVLPSI